MSFERSRPILILAGALLAAALLTKALAAEINPPPTRVSCDRAALAAEYDRKADEYAAAAGRYRTWASAEGMFGSGLHGSEWAFQQQAQRMDLAAERSRALAADARGRSNAESNSSATCDADTRAVTNG